MCSHMIQSQVYQQSVQSLKVFGHCNPLARVPLPAPAGDFHHWCLVTALLGGEQSARQFRGSQGLTVIS